MSVATAAAVVGAVGSAYSASQSGKGGSSTTKQEIDPRFAQYLYGTDDGSNQGLLSDAYSLYNKNRSGLNDQMVQGLNSQWNTYTNPANMAGYQQMANLGSGLMSAPVMGNPFATGEASLYKSGAGAGGSNLGMGGGTVSAAPRPSYTAQTGQAGQVSQAPGPFSMPAPPPPPPAPPPITELGQFANLQNLYNGARQQLMTTGLPGGSLVPTGEDGLGRIVQAPDGSYKSIEDFLANYLRSK